MKKIGCFRRARNGFIGEITTLHLNLPVQILPVTNQYLPGTVDYILTRGDQNGFAAEIGKGWIKHSREQNIPFIAVEIDDPSFSHALQAALCESDDPETYFLYWDRFTAGEHVVETLYFQEDVKPLIGLIRPPENISERLRQLFMDLTG